MNVEEIKDFRAKRFAMAYLAMAKEAKYRPAAPSDGFGHVQLSASELNDERLLHDEACAYAACFCGAEDEDHGHHVIGISNGDTNMVLVYLIEAARQLCGGSLGNHVAARLVRMALRDLLALDDRKHRARENRKKDRKARAADLSAIDRGT